jgi:hypothetical protein
VKKFLIGDQSYIRRLKGHWRSFSGNRQGNKTDEGQRLKLLAIMSILANSAALFYPVRLKVHCADQLSKLA